MIKLVFCLRRRRELSPEEFHRYWFEEHGPLVQRKAAAVGMRRYVQVHTLESPVNDALRRGRNTIEPFDGVAEAWWDSVDAMRAAGSTAEGREAAGELIEDEARFIDLARSAVWIAEERELIPLRDPAADRA